MGTAGISTIDPAIVRASVSFGESIIKGIVQQLINEKWDKTPQNLHIYMGELFPGTKRRRKRNMNDGISAGERMMKQPVLKRVKKFF